MEVMDRWSVLDEHLPRAIRTDLEERLWRPIEAQATLEALYDDPAFIADPGHHPAIFADHGVVHVRDVAAGNWLASTLPGRVMPSPAREIVMAAQPIRSARVVTTSK